SADSLGKLAVELAGARDVFARLAGLDPEQAKGQAADSMRERGARNRDLAEEHRAATRGSVRAIRAWADALETYVDDLAAIERVGRRRDLEMHDGRIHPPRLPDVPGRDPEETERWNRRRTDYLHCLDLLRQAREARNEAGKALATALHELTGATRGSQEPPVPAVPTPGPTDGGRNDGPGPGKDRDGDKDRGRDGGKDRGRDGGREHGSFVGPVREDERVTEARDDLERELEEAHAAADAAGAAMDRVQQLRAQQDDILTRLEELLEQRAGYDEVGRASEEFALLERDIVALQSEQLAVSAEHTTAQVDAIDAAADAAKERVDAELAHDRLQRRLG
ncbi:MAG: hypothetical protein LT071_05240, partial [Nocardioides sp.]|nr:hypothetical protein [Nocardioides sp.]